MGYSLRSRVPMLFALWACAASGCGDDTPTQPSPPPAQFRVQFVTPSSGPAGVATPIRVTGTGFQQGATLTLDNVVTPSTFVSSTQISAIAPPRAAGSIDVVVTNPNGQASRLERGYTYILTAIRLRITGNAMLFAAGETTQLTAVADFSDGTTGDVTAESRWESSATEVATVTQTGLVTALTLGSVSISARYPATTPTPSSRFAATTISITPPGTFVATGRVREPGSGGVPGASILLIATGQSILTPPSGAFSIAGLTDGRMLITKDGFESVSATAEANVFTDIPLQRVIHVEAGGAPLTDVLAPNDVEYHMNGDTICQPCRMIRVSSATSGTVRVRITWTELQSTLNLWLNGQMFPPTATREIVADLPITGGVEMQVYVGKIRAGIGNYVPFTFSVVPVN